MRLTPWVELVAVLFAMILVLLIALEKRDPTRQNPQIIGGESVYQVAAVIDHLLWLETVVAHIGHIVVTHHFNQRLIDLEVILKTIDAFAKTKSLAGGQL